MAFPLSKKAQKKLNFRRTLEIRQAGKLSTCAEVFAEKGDPWISERDRAEFIPDAPRRSHMAQPKRPHFDKRVDYTKGEGVLLAELQYKISRQLQQALESPTTVATPEQVERKLTFSVNKIKHSDGMDRMSHAYFEKEANRLAADAAKARAEVEHRHTEQLTTALKKFGRKMNKALA